MTKIIPTRITYNNSYRQGIEIQAYIPFSEEMGQIDISRPLHLSEYEHPQKAIITCAHCGQWAAKYTQCVHCGAPVGKD